MTRSPACPATAGSTRRSPGWPDPRPEFDDWVAGRAVAPRGGGAPVPTSEDLGAAVWQEPVSLNLTAGHCDHRPDAEVDAVAVAQGHCLAWHDLASVDQCAVRRAEIDDGPASVRPGDQLCMQV